MSSRILPPDDPRGAAPVNWRQVGRSKEVQPSKAAAAEPQPDYSMQIAQIRAWLAERDAASWDAQIEQDERAGRLDALVERALAEHRAGRTRPL